MVKLSTIATEVAKQVNKGVERANAEAGVSGFKAHKITSANVTIQLQTPKVK